MKYLFLLGAVAVIYLLFIRDSPIKQAKEAVTQTEAAPLVTGPREPAPPPHTNALKRPLDRTHEVLSQVEKRNGKGEF